MISSILNPIISWLADLPTMQTLLIVSVGALIAYIGGSRLLGWMRLLIMRYALKKTAALGLIGVLGTDYLIPGLDILEPLIEMLPI
jgi:hypothetical protein